MKRLPVGQLFVMGFGGTEVPENAKRLLVEHDVCGAILFKHNIESLEQVVALNAELFEIGKSAGTPPIVSIDQEGGRVARLRGIATDLPPMRAIGEGARADPELPYRVGAMVARELSALGIHWNFAPVVDVDTNPNNPVIGERSFGHDAAHVARTTARFIEGMQGAGIAGSAKHFPGHGDTAQDSHTELPRLDHSLERLLDVELVPFQAAVQAGVASIMTAHVMFPALDAKLPATLSPAILDGLLRKRLGYDGVIVSDALEMSAVAEMAPIEELVRLGLLAGIDLFLVCFDQDGLERSIEAVHRFVESGEVPCSRVEEALARVAKLKQRYVGAPAAPTLDEARRVVRCAPHAELARALEAIEYDASTRGESVVDVF